MGRWDFGAAASGLLLTVGSAIALDALENDLLISRFIINKKERDDPKGATTGAPTLGAPTTGAPTLGAPTLGAPTTGAPTTGAPTLGGTRTGAPTTGAPTLGGTRTGAPTMGGTRTGAPTLGGMRTGATTLGGTITGATQPSPTEAATALATTPLDYVQLCAANESGMCTCDGIIYHGLKHDPSTAKPGSGSVLTYEQMIAHNYNAIESDGTSVQCTSGNLAGDPYYGRFKQCYCVDNENGNEPADKSLD